MTFPKPVCLFTAAEAKAWGWIPQEGDQFLGPDDTWHPSKIGDSFEVEPINSRPWEVVIGQLVSNQALANEVEKLKIQVAQLQAEISLQDQKSVHYLTREEISQGRSER